MRSTRTRARPWSIVAGYFERNPPLQVAAEASDCVYPGTAADEGVGVGLDAGVGAGLDVGAGVGLGVGVGVGVGVGLGVGVGFGSSPSIRSTVTNLRPRAR